MRSPRLSAATVAVLLLGAGAASAREPPVSEIVVKGRGDAYVDIALPSAITIDPNAIQGVTEGTHVGFLLVGRTPGGKADLAAGSVVVPEFERLAPGLGPIGFSGGRVKAGTYRLLLVSDGEATLRIPAEGLGGSLTLRPRIPWRAVGRLDELEPPPGVGEIRVPIERKRDTVTLMGLLATVEHHQADVVEQCLVEDGGDSCDPLSPGASTGAVVSPGSIGRGWVFAFAGVYPGWVEPGRYVAVQRITDVSAAGDHLAFLLNVHLTGPEYRTPTFRPTPPRTELFNYDFAGPEGVPICGVFAAGYAATSCWGFSSRYPEQFLTIVTDDAAGGPVPGRVRWQGGGFEFCGEKEPVPIPQEEFIGVIVYAHPTAWCSSGHATRGSVAMTFHSTPPT